MLTPQIDTKLKLYQLKLWHIKLCRRWHTHTEPQHHRQTLRFLLIVDWKYVPDNLKYTIFPDRRTSVRINLMTIQPALTDPELKLGVCDIFLYSLNLLGEAISYEWYPYIIAGRRLIVNFLSKTFVINLPDSD